MKTAITLLFTLLGIPPKLWPSFLTDPVIKRNTLRMGEIVKETKERMKYFENMAKNDPMNTNPINLARMDALDKKYRKMYSKR